MNQREQETHLKLTCSCLLSLLSPSLVSSPLRSMEPANSLPCDPSNGFLLPRYQTPLSYMLSLSCFYLPQQATTRSTIPPSANMASLPHQHGRPSRLCRVCEAALLAERGPLTCLGCCQLLVMMRPLSNVIKKLKVPRLLKEGSTNMPLFGRVHKCKEHEHQSEKKV